MCRERERHTHTHMSVRAQARVCTHTCTHTYLLSFSHFLSPLNLCPKIKILGDEREELGVGGEMARETADDEKGEDTLEGKKEVHMFKR